jgi:hypothetical protein
LIYYTEMRIFSGKTLLAYKIEGSFYKVKSCRIFLLINITFKMLSIHVRFERRGTQS